MNREDLLGVLAFIERKVNSIRSVIDEMSDNKLEQEIDILANHIKFLNEDLDAEK